MKTVTHNYHYVKHVITTKQKHENIPDNIFCTKTLDKKRFSSHTETHKTF